MACDRGRIRGSDLYGHAPSNPLPKLRELASMIHRDCHTVSGKDMRGNQLEWLRVQLKG